MSNPRVSVIIPVYRDWDHLRLCLDALERQTMSKDEYEIIVANNEAEAPWRRSRSTPGSCMNRTRVHMPTGTRRSPLRPDGISPSPTATACPNRAG